MGKIKKNLLSPVRRGGPSPSRDEIRYPDHTSALARLKKIKGQIIGLEKMIIDQRYCVDILIQFRAIAAGLNVIEQTVFERHILNCLKRAISSGSKKEIVKKITELMDLIFKRL